MFKTIKKIKLKIPGINTLNGAATLGGTEDGNLITKFFLINKWLISITANAITIAVNIPEAPKFVNGIAVTLVSPDANACGTPEIHKKTSKAEITFEIASILYVLHNWYETPKTT